LNEQFLSSYPYLKVGDTLRLRVNGDDYDWVVVGFYQLGGKLSGFVAYTDLDYLTHLIGQPNHAALYRIVASHPGLKPAEQDELARLIERQLESRGISVVDISTGAALSQTASDGFNVLTAFLLFMAVLTALVGSIGLTGTMSMNVLERTREIGVMRAIGASNRILMKMVMVEGIIIGLISWLLGSLLAFPISKVMADSITQAIFDSASSFGFTYTGFVIWLVVVSILSILASVMPARNAARLTIREVLAYE
jgi:putative ABC transport system permease protein